MLEVYSPAARASAISYTVLRLPAGRLALAWYRINASCVVIPFASLPTLLPRISRVISRQINPFTSQLRGCSLGTQTKTDRCVLQYSLIVRKKESSFIIIINKDQEASPGLLHQTWLSSGSLGLRDTVLPPLKTWVSPGPGQCGSEGQVKCPYPGACSESSHLRERTPLSWWPDPNYRLGSCVPMYVHVCKYEYVYVCVCLHIVATDHLSWASS